MRLTDRVEVVRATEVESDFGWPPTVEYDWTRPVLVASLAAAVGYEAVSLTVTAADTDLKQELRCLIAPFAFDPLKHRIRWRGEVYGVDGPPMARRRNGRDHHLTLKLVKVV